MYKYWEDRTDTGLCESLWSVRPNSQLMTKLEMVHMPHMQALVLGCISAHPVLPHQKAQRETSDAWKSQLNQAS